jgi:hypothetical protein
VSHNNGIFNLDTFKISTNSYSEWNIKLLSYK